MTKNILIKRLCTGAIAVAVAIGTASGIASAQPTSELSSASAAMADVHTVYRPNNDRGNDNDHRDVERRKERRECHRHPENPECRGNHWAVM